MNTYSIKEYGLLLRGGNARSLDRMSIPKSTWDWLFENTSSTDNISVELIKPVRKYGEFCLQVVNYCGVLETPNGDRIEILPKISNLSDDLIEARSTLWRMLTKVQNIPLKSFNTSDLQLFDQPLIEALISKFLFAIQSMAKRGIRSDYVSRDLETTFLKGRLKVSEQMRKGPDKAHLFSVTCDEYLPDRAENRLIRTALELTNKWCQSLENKRLNKELLFIFQEIPKSRNVKADFDKWQANRGMTHYQPLKQWCELILNQKSPLSISGRTNGISFLFPMEVLFERYVGICLKKQMAEDYSLVSQSNSQYLVEHNGERWFQLKPDFLIKKDKKVAFVLDTKWKLIDQKQNSSSAKYGLSQGDFYQLFAYGEKYLGGVGDLYLIYPSYNGFDKKLDSFLFTKDLKLWVIPFNLKREMLVSSGESFL